MDILSNRFLRTSLHGLLGRRVTLHRHVSGEVRSAYRRLDRVSHIHLKRNTFGLARARSSSAATGGLPVPALVYRVNPRGRRIDWSDKGWATDTDRTRIPVMDAGVIRESPARRIILDTKAL